MKKRGLVLSIFLAAIIMVCPTISNAASGSIFGSNIEITETIADKDTTLNGNKISISQDGTPTIYLGVNVTSGTVTEYKATVKLKNSNFEFSKKGTKASGWTYVGDGVYADDEDPTIIHVDLKSSKGVGVGKHAVVSFVIKAKAGVPSTEECEIELTKASAPQATNPTCKQENGKYYDNNGVEVTEAEWKKACETQENPQTGSFLPFAAIIAGIAVAAGLYMVTKKNKIYHV